MARALNDRCPRCRARHPDARDPDEWLECACGERFVVTARGPRGDDGFARPIDRLILSLTYGLGGALLACLPVFVLGLRLIVSGAFFYVLAAAAVLGFVTAAVFGAGGLAAVGRIGRSLFERR